LRHFEARLFVTSLLIGQLQIARVAGVVQALRKFRGGLVRLGDDAQAIE